MQIALRTATSWWLELQSKKFLDPLLTRYLLLVVDQLAMLRLRVVASWRYSDIDKTTPLIRFLNRQTESREFAHAHWLLVTYLKPDAGIVCSRLNWWKGCAKISNPRHTRLVWWTEEKSITCLRAILGPLVSLTERYVGSLLTLETGCHVYTRFSPSFSF